MKACLNCEPDLDDMPHVCRRVAFVTSCGSSYS
jgi:hypothetical protein